MPMRHELALCGAGVMSVAHASAAASLGIPVTAVASRDPRHAVERTGTTGGQAVLYDELPAGADIVVVCTPPSSHATHALRAFDAGAAVLVEVPLCATLDDADALVDATAGEPHRLLYAENLAHSPVVRAMLARIGHLGVPEHLAVRAIQPRPTWGEHGTPAWGGGALFDLGSHPMALALLCADAAGCGDVVSVTSTLDSKDAIGGVDDHAEVSIRFASGLRAAVTASWRGGDVPQWDVQMASATGVLRAEIQPHTLLEHDGEEVPVAGGKPELGGLDSRGYVGQISSLLMHVRSGRSPLTNAEFGRRVLEVVCAAYWSAGQDGTEVTLPFAGPRDRTPHQLWRG